MTTIDYRFLDWIGIPAWENENMALQVKLGIKYTVDMITVPGDGSYTDMLYK